MVKKNCIVMFSGGLDSRLVVKIMQNKKFDITVIYFRLPFSKDNLDEVKKFLKLHKVKYKIFDITKGKLLKEYIDAIKKAQHGRGAGVNPCVDCKIFMFKTAKKFAKKQGIKHIASGEVVGQRPMSQRKKQLKTIEEEAGIKDMILRPLSDEYGIFGRKREKQIEISNKFDIDYPDPAGGCLLCEKTLIKKFEYLLKRGINDIELKLVNIGRHFVIDDCWIVLGRNESENKIIEKFKNAVIPSYIGPSAVILDTYKATTIKKIKDLIKAYSKKGSLKDRAKFDKWKL